LFNSKPLLDQGLVVLEAFLPDILVTPLARLSFGHADL